MLVRLFLWSKRQTTPEGNYLISSYSPMMWGAQSYIAIPRKVRLPQEGVVSMDVFVDRIEELLRLALRQAILSPISSGNSLVDWKKLIVGD